jgi:hypothetical protein
MVFQLLTFIVLAYMVLRQEEWHRKYVKVKEAELKGAQHIFTFIGIDLYIKVIPLQLKARHYNITNEPINISPILEFMSIVEENEEKRLKDLSITANTIWKELGDCRKLVITKKQISVE